MESTITESSQPQVTVGVDTYKHFHVAHAVDQLGRPLGTHRLAATPAGYRGFVSWAHTLGQLVAVGIEGPGHFGAGLARHLPAGRVTLTMVRCIDPETPHHGDKPVGGRTSYRGFGNLPGRRWPSTPMPPSSVGSRCRSPNPRSPFDCREWRPKMSTGIPENERRKMSTDNKIRIMQTVLASFVAVFAISVVVGGRWWTTPPPPPPPPSVNIPQVKQEVVGLLRDQFKTSDALKDYGITVADDLSLINTDLNKYTRLEPVRRRVAYAVDGHIDYASTIQRAKADRLASNRYTSTRSPLRSGLRSSPICPLVSSRRRFDREVSLEDRTRRIRGCAPPLQGHK